MFANTPVLIPRSVYPPGGLPTRLPVATRRRGAARDDRAARRLSEAGRVLGDDGRGQRIPWKPVVYLIVTVPVFLDALFAGAEVTTVTTEYSVNGDPSARRSWCRSAASCATASQPRRGGATRGSSSSDSPAAPSRHDANQHARRVHLRRRLAGLVPPRGPSAGAREPRTSRSSRSLAHRADTTSSSRSAVRR